MSTIAGWLEGLGLAQYVPVFAENAVDSDVLFDLTEADLQNLGIPLGDRKRMLKAIAACQKSCSTPRTSVTAATVASPRSEAERRHLTILFCDLVGSTALSAILDPEDLRAVIGAYHNCISDIIVQYQGVIARYMGDGVLAYFGYPQAHEDDAEQATRAGLALVDSVANLKTDTCCQATGSRWHCHGHGGRGRSDRRRRWSGALGRWCDAEPRRAPANAGGARDSVDLPEHATAHGGALRLPRSRPYCAERLGGAGTGLASAADERRREPFRGDAQDQAGAADRA